jgi:hypothetical protein
MSRLACLPLVVLSAAVVRADHWAWTPPVRPPMPAGHSQPIDALVRAKLTAAGLTPAPPATREQLIRRATFGLTGLPPTPEETAAFVADQSPNAWERVIDRLLASSAYGERWGRHWLDLARYADSNGYEYDEPRPDAWRYRDYVIRSLNADKPYDRFVTEQLAGDEAYPHDPDALVATGFNLLGPDMTDSSDQPARRQNTLADMTDTAGLAFLGLTVACARCHDHKFEPITQADYFRMQAFFTPAEFRRDLPAVGPDRKAAFAAAERDYLDRTKAVRDEVATIEGPVRVRLAEERLAKLTAEAREAHRTPADKRTGGQVELVRQTEGKVRVTDAQVAEVVDPADRGRLVAARETLKTFDHLKPAPLPTATGLTDRPGPPGKTFLLARGEVSSPEAEVAPGYLAVLSPGRREVPAAVEPLPASSGRRLALARWLTRPDHPLTARVMANRLWQGHFGRGIVPTPSDFGVRGEPPTHPELLDYLATELVEGGWRLKRIHKLILMSETYQQSTRANPGDADNALFSRQNRQRLDAEAVRDALLAIGGRLNLAAGGPGVVTPEVGKPGGGAKPIPVTADPKEFDRRSVYLYARRNLRSPFLEAFDLPDSNLSCPRRERSTTAIQALALLNSPEAADTSAALAGRLTREAGTDAGRLDRAYRLALGRPPSAAERDRAAEFLRGSPLVEFCRALTNLNEFVYLD